MKQIRLEPLGSTYQQLGSLLCQTALSIQSTDYTNQAAWTSLLHKVQHTYAVFTGYAKKEEDVLFPILHNFEPALAAIIRDHQYGCLRYLNNLNALFGAMHAATNIQKSKLFSHKLLYRIDEFVAATMRQLQEQEEMINAVLWRYYTDKEILQIAASLSIAASASFYPKDTSFADKVIKNIAPVTTIKGIQEHTKNTKAAKQQRTSKELAAAV